MNFFFLHQTVKRCFKIIVLFSKYVLEIISSADHKNTHKCYLFMKYNLKYVKESCKNKYFSAVN